MLRWIACLTATCVCSGVVGLGLAGAIDGSARGWCLALTALSATMLISSFDAYETEPAWRDRADED